MMISWEMTGILGCLNPPFRQDMKTLEKVPGPVSSAAQSRL